MALSLMDTGIVVIGRNEGERLRRCLESLPACPAIYVDSGSSDGSVALARSLGVESIGLDAPFSAAKARNRGFQALVERHRALDYVQFLDGDCTLAAGWIDAARAALDADPRRAAVLGQVLERNARASIYNRLCELEWRSAPGDLRNFGQLGGIALMRARAFRAVGGFRPEVIAGEDSELGVRLALAGYRVTKIAVPMATHDADLRSFGQWWRRAVRAGHAIGQRCHLHGASPLRDCVHDRASTLFWGVGLPLAVAASALASEGASLWLLAAYPALALRVWQARRTQADDAREAALYAAFVLLAKFAHAVGLLKFAVNRRTGRYRIIEYK